MKFAPPGPRSILIRSWPSAIVAVAAWISIVVCIDPAGSYPSMPQGPGLTVDEIFNVEQGVYLVEQTRALGWYNLIPGTSDEAFRPENGYNPDHPPLGRYWLGAHHQLTWWMAPPFQPDGPFVTACARTGSATAFALTVWIIGIFAGFVSSTASPSRLTNWESFFASLSLVLMPRVYGHAHLASLETITNLTCTAAVLVLAAWWSGTTKPTLGSSALAGVLLGLALLTKIQAILIPIPVIFWALCRWRARSLLPLAIWGGTALTVFFVGWPYLWLKPYAHLLEYLGRTTNRAVLHCYYLGTRYADRDVPWHYPFVMFLLTVPLALHLLGVWGIWRPNSANSQEKDVAPANVHRWRDWLLLGCCLFPLVVFALPGVAVYDGERLFLTVFPLWAVFVGRGAAEGARIAIRRLGPGVGSAVVAIALTLQFSETALCHPHYLSYYSFITAAGGGPDRMGLEMDYWGDSLTRTLLTEAVTQRPEFASVEVVPSLHQFQNDDLVRQSPILRQRLSQPRTFQFTGSPLRIVFRRRADLDDKTFFEIGGPETQRSSLATFNRPVK